MFVGFPLLAYLARRGTLWSKRSKSREDCSALPGSKRRIVLPALCTDVEGVDFLKSEQNIVSETRKDCKATSQ